jgi:hypothetical protein
MISTRLQLTVKNKVKLCFVCSGTPFFYLFVGRAAETVWVANVEAPVAKSDRDPPWIPKHKLFSSDMDWSRQDQVVIYEGHGPLFGDAIWTSGAMRVAWIDLTGRGRARVPKGFGWCVYRRAVKHSSLGGVTDAIFSCFLVSKVAEDCEWQLTLKGIKTTLCQAVDPTNGGRTVKVPEVEGNSPDELGNTGKGLLQWHRRFGKVIVPTVYSKDMWAERRLTDFEMADVLDLPGTLRKRLNAAQLGKVKNMGVPGKVVVALFESLNALVTQDTERTTGAEAQFGKRGTTRKAESKDLYGSTGRVKEDAYK